MGKKTKTLSYLEQEYNWKNSGHFVTGEKSGYWFSVSHPRGLVAVKIRSFFSNYKEQLHASIKEDMKSFKKKYKAVDISINDKVITVTVASDTNSDKLNERVTGLIEDMAFLFREKGLEPGCAFCEENNNLEAVSTAGEAIGICSECYEKAATENEKISAEIEFEGNYFTGIIGAFAGALLGSLLWLLVSYIGFYASIVGFAMAFLAHKGYVIFKGRRQRAMAFIVSLAVISGVIIANVLEVGLGIAMDPHLEFSYIEAFMLSPYSLFDTEMFYVGRVWGGIGLGMLFAVLGSWKMIQGIYVASSPDLLKIERI